MHSLALLTSCLGLAELCLATPGTLQLTTHRNYKKHSQVVRRRTLAKRAGTETVILNSDPYDGGGFYFVNATVGSDKQPVNLDLDTGSSDVWMFGADYCAQADSQCAGGSYDPSSSDTSTHVADNFSIRYFTPGSGVKGSYYKDTFAVAGIKIDQLEVGVASDAASVTTGIMGISFDADEAQVGQLEQEGEKGFAYPNFIDRLKTDGIIGTRSYSIWLNSIDADTGSIIFGGYDKSKFEGGELNILPILKDADTDSFDGFSVLLNSVGVTDGSSSTALSSSDTPAAVIFDTGTAFTLLPAGLVTEIANYLGAEYVESYGYIIECDVGGMKGTIDYQFGNANGPVISVPFNQLAVPFLDDNGDLETDDNGNPICLLGLDKQSQEGEPLLFGDTFLRSAYIVHDLDNLQVGVAQTVFNSTAKADVVAISASSTGQNLPGTTVSQATTIQQTASGGLIAGPNTVANATGKFTATRMSLSSNSAGLTGVSTSYADRATNIPGSSTRKPSAANSIRSPSWSGLALPALVVLGGVVAGALAIL